MAAACTSEEDRPPFQSFAFVSDRDGNSEIYLADPTSGTVSNLTSHPAFDSRPTWSPDGERIAFISDRDGGLNLYVMAADGTGVTALTDLQDVAVHTPEWSPNGDLIAWASNMAQIWTTNLDGVSTGPFTSLKEWALTPSWLPGSERIAYEAQPGLTTMALDGSDRQVVLERDRLYTRATKWSPVGTRDEARIVFVAGRTKETTRQLMIGELTESSIRLTTLKTDLVPEGTRLDWDDAGRHIIFGADGDLWSLDVGTAVVTRLTDSPSSETLGTWRPLPSQ